MKFYAITYDLRQPGRKYDELYEEIKKQAGDSNWQHPMESFWVIAVSEYSPKDKETMYKALRQYIDDMIVCSLRESTIQNIKGGCLRIFGTGLKKK